MSGSHPSRSAVLSVGLAVQDFIFFVDELPRQPVKYRARNMVVVGGGCAATASAAIGRLGARSMLAARLGQDSVGDRIVEELETYGVDCSLVRRFPECRSSMSSIFVDGTGERMIVNFRDIGLPDECNWLPDLAGIGVGAVLADTRWSGGAEAAMAAANAAGLPGILDAEGPVREAEAAVGLASHIAFSRNGLVDWTGHDDLQQGIRDVAEQTGAFVSVTDGAHGTWYVDTGGEHHVPAFAVDAVDTLGAGDVWHGAFALRLAEGADNRSAIRFASAAAAIKCSRFGGRAGIPDRGEVEAFMAEYAA
ncbi:MAG TPA: PfkB family carbohydrate kinase [Afifellaceae bacterium]|nr:PfkB family carbohydrate kinase [Afifellaceae bacterium]